jgi:hypothetical protein
MNFELNVGVNGRYFMLFYMLATLSQISRRYEVHFLLLKVYLWHLPGGTEKTMENLKNQVLY